MIKIVYFGTTEVSARVLHALASTQSFSVLAVVTQPGRPVGRKQEVQPSPVKVAAEKLGIPVFEPQSLKDFNVETVGAENFLPLQTADVFVVYSYGLIIPQRILDIPKHGTINIHPSLLPKYRGPSPVQSALVNGETETGLSIMLLDAQMDHGPLLAQTKMKIDTDDTATTLMDKLMAEAIPLTTKVINQWIEKKISPIEQDHSAATICKMFTRDDGKIDWTTSAAEIYNRYRGLTPWPGIWTMWDGKRLKLLRVAFSQTKGGASGIVSTNNNALLISCGSGSIEVQELQLEGKKPMSARDFLNGNKTFFGSKLV